MFSVFITVVIHSDGEWENNILSRILVLNNDGDKAGWVK